MDAELDREVSKKYLGSAKDSPRHLSPDGQLSSSLKSQEYQSASQNRTQTWLPSGNAAVFKGNGHLALVFSCVNHKAVL